MNYFIIFILSLIASFLSSIISKFVFSYFQAKAMQVSCSDVLNSLHDLFGDLDDEED